MSSNQESKGRKASAERKVGECYQWKAHGHCSKGDSCSFRHDPASGNRCDQSQEGQPSSPAPKVKAQTDGKRPSKSPGSRGEGPSGTSGRIPCGKFLRRQCTNPSCNFWHPPVCLNCKSGSGCKYGDNVDSDTLRLMGCKKSKKSCVKGSVALLKESTQLGCVSQGSHPTKSTPLEEGKFGSNHTVKFSKGTWHHIKIPVRKGPHSVRSQIWGQDTRRNLAPRKMRPQSSMGLFGEKIRTKRRFTLLLKPGQRRRPHQNLQRNEHSWLTPEH